LAILALAALFGYEALKKAKEAKSLEK